MTVRSRPHVKSPSARDGSWARSFYDAMYPTRQGKFDCTQVVTLTANAASTTVMDYRLSPQSFVGAMPQTANAAAEIGNGTMYFAPTDGQCVITHANNAQVDRTFTLVILG